MTIARRYLYSILLAIGAAPIAAQSQPASFVPLPEFVAAVSSARYADYAASPHFAVASEVEFETMRAHLLTQYQGITATNSFLIGTQYVDCVPIMQQPSVRQLRLTAIATPPPPPRVNASEPPPSGTVQPLLSLGLTDAFGNAMQCDEGTIPMRRVTLKDLSRFPTLNAFFAKKPPPSIDPTMSCNQDYRYAVGSNGTSPPFYGAQTTLAIWYPAINPSYGTGQHSLSQMWVEGTSSTSPLQTAEAGWTVDPNRTGTSAATLFVFWTSNNYFNGCYDLDCGTFVQRSNTWVLGAPNWPGPSVPGSSQGQVVFGPLQWTFYQNNWWLSAGICPYGKDCTVGYYQGSLYGTGQMSQFANVLLFGGEVSSATPPQFSQMGSGAPASAGALYAANQWNTSSVTSSYNVVPTTLSLVQCNTNSSCHTFACANPSCSDFYFGGPGGPNCP